MAESVANAVFLRSRAGKEEELAGRLEALVLASRSDPGVTTYDLHRSTADPASWFLYERYESQEHFNRYKENRSSAISLWTPRHFWTGNSIFERSG